MKNSILRRFYFCLSSFIRITLISKRLGKLGLWKEVYEKCSGIESDYYISEPYFYNFLERRLNDFGKAIVFEHKGYIGQILNSNYIPNKINFVNGLLYDSDDNILSLEEAYGLIKSSGCDLVLKQSFGTGGGKNVIISNPAEILSHMNRFIAKNTDFVIQDRLRQHPDISKYNKSSLNTVRVMTLRLGTEINLVSTVLRMGNGGFVDNSSSGGLSVGVNKAGVLNNFALNKNFEKFTTHPNSGISFLDRHTLPFYNEMVKLAKQKHLLLKDYGLISWDITVDVDGNISIVEYNVIWSEVNFHQANNGDVFKPFIKQLRG